MTKLMCRAFNRSSRNEFVKNGYYLNTGDMYIIQYVCMYELLHKIMINMYSMKYNIIGCQFGCGLYQLILMNLFQELLWVSLQYSKYI